MVEATDVSPGAPSGAGGGDLPFPALGRTWTVLVLLAICTAVGLLFASHFRVYYRIEWPLALWWGLKDWYLWGALAPFVVWLVRRAPPSREHWPRTVVLHLLAASFLAVLHPTLAISLSALVEGLGNASFLESVQGLFLKRYTLSFTTYVAIAAVGVSVDSFRRSRRRGTAETSPSGRTSATSPSSPCTSSRTASTERTT